ncbi:MAG: glycosyl hydrolase [Nitrososphaerota archaeon]
MNAYKYNKLVVAVLLTAAMTVSLFSVSFSLQSSKAIYSYGAVHYGLTYRYGVCFHAPWEYNPTTKEIISNLGKIWVRSDWKLSNNMISWKNDMKHAGLKVLGIINYVTLNWKPFNLTDWERLVEEVVTAAPDVDAWEIWNEPDAQKFQLGYMDGTPEHYFEMLKIAYTVVKNKTNALVVGPAISSSGLKTDWLQRLVDLGALNYLDVISIHLYFDTVSNNQNYLDRVRSIVGDKPIWVTEIGKPSAITRTEEFQDNYLKTNFDPNTGLDADKLFWYELVDNPSLSESYEGYFGLVRANYTFKPSYYSFKSLIS